MTRAVVERGQIPEAVGREQQWIEERIRVRRSGGEDIEREVQVSDGRWFLVRECVTRDGGVVGIWHDITKRKAAEAALQESNKRFQDMAESVSDWFWEMDENLRFVYLSEGERENLDYEVDDVTGLTRWERAGVDPDKDEAWQKHRADLEARKPFRDFRFSVEIPDGGTAYRSVSGKPMFDKSGVFRGYRGTASDITTEVLAEQALRESEERYAFAVSGTAEGLWDYNIQTGEEYQSPRWKRILGYEDHELDNRHETFTGALHPEDHDRVMEATRAHLEERVPYDLEYRLRCKNGSYVWIHAKGQAIWDEFGTPLRMAGSNADITERKRSEQALHDSEERFRALMDNSPVAISLKDAEGRYRFINRRFEAWYGISGADALGKKAGDLFPNDHIETSAAIERQVLEAAKTVEQAYEEEFADELRHQIVATKFPVFDAGGNTVGIGTFYIDVTEQRHTETQLRQAQKMEAVGQMTGGVAHDFNNLLGIILGNAQLLENKLKEDKAAKLLRPVIQATRRGAELTSRLLAFSRQQPLNPQALDIGELCIEMTGLLRRTLGETVEIDLRIGELSPARADSGQLENALLNLALNARDAMPAGGKLTIEMGNVTLTGADMDGHRDGQPGDYVALKVSDNGTGMAPDVVEHVFEPFFTTKEVGAGSGLGLSMVYGFAQQSGGHVTIESEAGQGTTVALYLPRAAAEDARREAMGEAIPRGRGETILVVEDEPDLRQVTVQQLEDLGYKTLQAPDGPLALEVLADNSGIDLLLSDVVLPGGMNGPEMY